MFQVKESILSLVERLGEALDAEGINYCQWKGHWKRSRWAAGEGDIDLLVNRVDEERFTIVLSRLGFKQAVSTWERQIPGVVSFYGFDFESNNFIHLHVHYQILLGHYLTMNYHIPLERPLLESVIGGDPFCVPAPEFELVIFVIRMTLGYSGRALINRQQAATSTAVQKELEYLQSRADPAKVQEILRQHLPFIGAALFDVSMLSLSSYCPPRTRLKLKQRMHARLKGHARRSQLHDLVWKLGCRIIGRARQFIFRQSSRNRLASGGKVIALIGGDGAGKSTAIDELYAWLSKKLDTTRSHLGKPPRSLMTVGVAIARRAALLFGKLFGRGHSIAARVDGDVPSTLGYLRLLRSVFVARDRYKLYVKARRAATNGSIVLCDRFPTPQLKSMDGPNIKRLLGVIPGSRFTANLFSAEASYYERIMPPDLLIVLRVDPETAVRRKTDEEPDYVRSRSQEVWQSHFEGTGAWVVDANLPRADVLSELKTIIWAHL